MTKIRAAHAALDDARRQLALAVQEARTQGRTWAQIGEELDMTKQAAFKRFGRPVDPQTGEALARRSAAGVAELTEQVCALIAAADYDRLMPLLHPRTAEELPADLIAETWRAVVAEVGAWQRCTGTRVELPDGTVVDPDDEVSGVVVGATTLECEAGSIVGRVAVSADSQVVGLLLVPTDHGPLPF
ncbi:hypothetical protein [Cellulomonas sp. PhB150]|uniref:hypothetical protein n=1 Tax=Cellulomonas sp. PhB150 TaxID=2485188 RepID=UPI000F46ECEC|nr:hypothetical protein [Cellulomonas sp. PhB150]ROS23035.1 hypothetical protein EDF34_3211 [Cellulomonas sp. PhB150]